MKTDLQITEKPAVVLTGCYVQALIPMTDFVLERDKREEVSRQDFIKCRNYANFLKQSLSMGMFIPCDLDGNILEPHIGGMREQDARIHQRYSEAKDRVIFEGFELADYGFNITNDISKTICFKDVLHVFWFSSITQTWTISKGLSTIEDLVKYGLTVKSAACT